VKKLIELYKKSLKPLEIEEILDAYLYRIFAFLIAYPFKNTSLSPNYFTLISMILGFLSGFFFLRNKLLIGALFLILANIFDCADGQLARLNKKTSKFGKTLDGLADYITYISIFTGISYNLFLKGYPASISLYGFASLLFMFIHIIYFDHFKNEYISYVLYKQYPEKSENIVELKNKTKLYYKKNKIEYILSLCYLSFYKIEYFLVSFAYPKNYKGFVHKYGNKNPTFKDSIRYKNNFKIFVRLWTFFGASSHMTIFIIFVILNKPLYIFHFFSIFYNFALIVLAYSQKNKFKKIFV